MGLERVNVTGQNNVGALAGVLRGAVKASYATGAVHGETSVGGLVGQVIATGEVSASYATGSVSGLLNVGGLVGSVTASGRVKRSYADSVVLGTGSRHNFGGLVGFLEGTVKASYARGSVTGAGTAGGLVGVMDGRVSPASVEASYATAAVRSSGGSVGGLIGIAVGSSASDSYWDSDTSLQSSSAAGVAVGTTGLQSPTGYTGIYTDWNLNLDGAGRGDNPWDFGTAKQYPALKADWNGDGTETVEEFGRQKRYVSVVDYDGDNDNLIEVSSLEQLDAIRYDLNGNGVPTSMALYEAAFPSPAPGMGCPDTCVGYELTASLDFDQNGDRVINAADTPWWMRGTGWLPIGDTQSSAYNAVFEGNGHTISHLFIKRQSTGARAGLFRYVGPSGHIRNVGLEQVNVTGDLDTGALVGVLQGRVEASYATGMVAGQSSVGGLVGYVDTAGLISTSYAVIDVRRTGGSGDDLGGLAGVLKGRLQASYARGSVTSTGTAGGLVGAMRGTVEASYATGAVQSSGSNVGGLAGLARGAWAASNIYWDTVTSGRTSSAAGDGKTTTELQRPTRYKGIYAHWDLDLGGSPAGDDPWDFGRADQYPVLKADRNGDGRATVEEFGHQLRGLQAIDYDTDNDNLIEVSSLAQLSALRWDLNGDGVPNVAAVAQYFAAFPDETESMGCPGTCAGYELKANLDFDTDNVSGPSSGDAYWARGKGWMPIGAVTAQYDAVFEGNGHTISNLFIDRSAFNDVGLFGRVRTGGRIRNVGLEHAQITGNDMVGTLVGSLRGEVKASYATGAVSGNDSIGGLAGLVGTACRVSASYATSYVDASGYAGGLVGVLYGRVEASYAKGSVTGSGYAGGLVGQMIGTVEASYATGLMSTSSLSHARGLVGHKRSGGTVSNSYWDTATSGQGRSDGGDSKTTTELQGPTGYAGIYVDWNLDLDNADSDDDLATNPDDPWDFGTKFQYPVLKVDFNNDRTATVEEFGSQPRYAEVNDYDADDDGLIEIVNLVQLAAINNNPTGDGVTHPTGADERRYRQVVFHNSMPGMGCPDSGCIGYELIKDLDFDVNKDGTVNLADFDTNRNGKEDRGEGEADLSNWAPSATTSICPNLEGSADSRPSSRATATPSPTCASTIPGTTYRGCLER